MILFSAFSAISLLDLLICIRLAVKDTPLISKPIGPKNLSIVCPAIAPAPPGAKLPPASHDNAAFVAAALANAAIAVPVEAVPNVIATAIIVSCPINAIAAPPNVPAIPTLLTCPVSF